MHSTLITIPGAPHNFTLTNIHSQFSSFAYSTKLTRPNKAFIFVCNEDNTLDMKQIIEPVWLLYFVTKDNVIFYLSNNIKLNEKII